MTELNEKTVLYIFNGGNLSSPYFSGVRKKILGQCAAFKRLGYAFTILYYEDDHVKFRTNTNECISYRCSLKMWSRRKYISFLKDYLEKHQSEFDLVYARKSLETPSSLAILKKLRKHSKRIVSEIPTYPYDKELKGDISKLSLLRRIKAGIMVIWCDKICRNLMKRHIDCFAVVTDKKEYTKVFGAPAIPISNGIDIDSIKIRNRMPSEIISLIGVANVSSWHGYDRLIRGLHEYYSDGGERDVVFHIVGEGVALGELRQLTQDLGLEHRVVFHGFKTGEELDTLFDNADIGVGSLGIHRIGLNKSATLKSREYCVRQLPFIAEGSDITFPPEFSWRHQVPSSDDPIDVASLVSFHDRCVVHIGNIDEMGMFAREYLSWDTQMKKIL